MNKELIDKLKLYRDLNLSKKKLVDFIKKNHYENLKETKIECVMINRSHVIHLLEKFKATEINLNTLLEWVNFIWFSDWYSYAHGEDDCIASIMSELEELDEEGKCLDNKKIELFITYLKNNHEFSK